MQKLLLFGNMGEIDTAVAIELADHATVSISQTHTSPHTSRHNMKMGNMVGGSFNANANYWVCHIDALLSTKGSAENVRCVREWIVHDQ